MFKMEISNEGGSVHRSKIIYPPKKIEKNNYEDCGYQVECDSEENPGLDKIFSKVMRKLNIRYGNNVST